MPQLVLMLLILEFKRTRPGETAQMNVRCHPQGAALWSDIGIRVTSKNRFVKAAILFQLSSFDTLLLAQNQTPKTDNNIFERTYTREELQQTAPTNPSPSISSHLVAHVTNFLTRMTANQNSSNSKLMGFYDKSCPLAANERALHLDAFVEPDQRNIDTVGLRLFLGEQARKAGTDQLKESSDFVRSISVGLSCDINLTSFSKNKDSTAPKTGNNTIRYGLIVKKIKIVSEGPGRASIQDSENGTEMLYAGRARVDWDIGPVFEDEKRRVFDFREENEDHSNTSTFSNSLAACACRPRISARESNQRRLILQKGLLARPVKVCHSKQHSRSPKGSILYCTRLTAARKPAPSMNSGSRLWVH